MGHQLTMLLLKDSFMSQQNSVTKYTVIFFIAVFYSIAFPEQKDFSKIDRVVLGFQRAKSIKKVIKFISRRSKTDWDKVRGAYVWVTNNIEYDVKALSNSEIPLNQSAEDVFTARKSVCQGYSVLFNEICTRLGLKSVIIPGYSKGAGYSEGDTFSKTNHTWNAIYLDGEWHVMETTWGAGYVVNNKFIREYNTIWFNTDPRLFLFNHFPLDTNWLLFTPALSLSEFEAMPYVHTNCIERFSKAGFSTKVQLALYNHAPFPQDFANSTIAFAKMGGKLSDIISFLKQGTVPSFWSFQSVIPKLIVYPKESILTAGKIYKFTLKLPYYDDVAIINGDKFTHLKNKDDLFFGEVKVVSGEVRLSAEIMHNGEFSFWTLASWRCE